ncbi:MAG: histone-like nucleoid-structuring protein, MvaT/MvaU family [Halomonas sp.]|uniref:histone-like nucleoid-structuring protein, MvaT/MvaU family n=1 Tax=Halomonas sp. TaxID=1486246 RepID=UPI002ACEDB34|nr:histone-like nucleoid-structuring protein, MvaT/MvaU family [Halomonas sp.]MDZ7852291.1 histone-like nucleoid-structuring protein, MvaT/MvaU family [Halomonas sp.]
MSFLNTYLQKEEQLKQLQEELKKMENDERLKSELDFKNHLETLMREFDKSAADVIKLLDPTQSTSKGSSGSTGSGRAKRKLKIYKNPNTGEVVETRGGNQKTLKAWKDEYGSETVEGWLVRTED